MVDLEGHSLPSLVTSDVYDNGSPTTTVTSPSSGLNEKASAFSSGDLRRAEFNHTFGRSYLLRQPQLNGMDINEVMNLILNYFKSLNSPALWFRFHVRVYHAHVKQIRKFITVCQNKRQIACRDLLAAWNIRDAQRKKAMQMKIYQKYKNERGKAKDKGKFRIDSSIIGSYADLFVPEKWKIITVKMFYRFLLRKWRKAFGPWLARRKDYEHRHRRELMEWRKLQTAMVVDGKAISLSEGRLRYLNCENITLLFEHPHCHLIITPATLRHLEELATSMMGGKIPEEVAPDADLIDTMSNDDALSVRSLGSVGSVRRMTMLKTARGDRSTNEEKYEMKIEDADDDKSILPTPSETFNSEGQIEMTESQADYIFGGLDSELSRSIPRSHQLPHPSYTSPRKKSLWPSGSPLPTTSSQIIPSTGSGHEYKFEGSPRSSSRLSKLRQLPFGDAPPTPKSPFQIDLSNSSPKARLPSPRSLSNLETWRAQSPSNRSHSPSLPFTPKFSGRLATIRASASTSIRSTTVSPDPWPSAIDIISLGNGAAASEEVFPPSCSSPSRNSARHLPPLPSSIAIASPARQRV